MARQSGIGGLQLRNGRAATHTDNQGAGVKRVGSQLPRAPAPIICPFDCSRKVVPMT